MANFNKVILAGNLTREIEMRYTPKGTPIANFGIAINRTWKNEAGEKKESVCFIDCKCFGKSAETLAQYVKKGNPLLVEGRIDLESWEDKQSGDKRQKLTVAVESFQFLNSAPKDGKPAAQSGKGKHAPKSTAAETSEPIPADAEFDDVPF